MEIENMNGEGNVSFIISGIQGDMGEWEEMSLIQQADGDVIVKLSHEDASLSMEFCTSNGGGRYPVIAKKLRELIAALVAGEKR